MKWRLHVYREKNRLCRLESLRIALDNPMLGGQQLSLSENERQALNSYSDMSTCPHKIRRIHPVVRYDVHG